MTLLLGLWGPRAEGDRAPRSRPERCVGQYALSALSSTHMEDRKPASPKAHASNRPTAKATKGHANGERYRRPAPFNQTIGNSRGAELIVWPSSEGLYSVPSGRFWRRVRLPAAARSYRHGAGIA